MKHLNEYINESILSDFEDQRVEDIAKGSVEDFLKDNYGIKGSYEIVENGDKLTIDVKGNVNIKNNQITSLTDGSFEFGAISGDFDCYGCKSLTSLEGAPKEVGIDFNCSYCSSLTSLKGAPEEVGGNFYCYDCQSLASLEGAPKKVKGDFSCGECQSLTSLKGAPKEVGGNFYCSSCRSLTSLEGAPEKVGEVFDCSGCGNKFSKVDVKKVCDVKKEIRI